MQNDKSKFKNEFKARLYKWVLRLVKNMSGLPKNNTNDVISKQLVRSGTSILANYIEGQAASSKKDFTNFLNHSLKSANESKVWLALLRDTDQGDKKELDYLLKEVSEIANIFASSILTLKNKK